MRGLALLVAAAALFAGCLSDGTGAGNPSPTPSMATPSAPAGNGCPVPEPVEALHSAEELAAALEVTNKMEASLPEEPFLEPACLLRLVAPHLVAFDGGRYANLSGWMNLDTMRGSEEGRYVQGWRVWVYAHHPDAPRPDIYGSDIEVRNGTARVLGEPEPILQAVPPARVEAARIVFESSPQWAEVRERAPHLLENNTRWTREGAVILHYSSYEGGGIPEHPFAFVEVFPDEARVGEVRKSDWWNASRGG